MSGPMKKVVFVGIALCLMGCEPDPIGLDVSFPTEESFLYSDYAEIYMFDISAAERGQVCSELLIGLLNDTLEREPVSSSGPLSACDLRSNGYTFEDIGEGTRAFATIVNAVDAGTTPLLYGCVTADTYVDSPSVTLELMTVLGARDLIETIGTLGCRNVEEKCRGLC